MLCKSLGLRPLCARRTCDIDGFAKMSVRAYIFASWYTIYEIDPIRRKSSITERTEYLNKLIEWKDAQVIKVVTGIRRSGKSTLLELYADYLRQNGVADEQIIFINFEDLENEHLLDYKVLYKHITDRLCRDKYTYIFLDEIQKVEDFEKAVDSLYIKKKTQTFI